MKLGPGTTVGGRTALSILAGILLTIGCRRDVYIGPYAAACGPPTCQPLAAPPSPQGWSYRYDPHWFKDARFDPADSNAILLTYAPLGGSLRQVYRFDLLTHDLLLIYEGHVIYPSEWGDDGWVVINTMPGHVSKVKVNGDSLTQLTYSGNCFAPIMDKHRTRIGYHTTTDQRSEIIDMHGEHLDTLEHACGFRDLTVWLEGDVLATLYFDGLEYTEIANCDRHVIAPMPEGAVGGGAGIAHLGGNHVMWSTSQGMFRTDLITGSTRCIRPACNSSYHSGLSYDPASDKILTVRMDLIPDGEYLDIRSTLVRMRSDGSEYEELITPW